MPVSQTEHIPQVFDVSSLKGVSQCPCLFPGCPGSSRTLNVLRNHFNRQHWEDGLSILEEHPTPFPKCESCRSQVTPWSLRNRHCESDKFRLGEKRRTRRATLQQCFEAIKMYISVSVDPMEPVAALLYLLLTVVYNNSGWVALYQNLWKSWWWWGWWGR